MRVHICSFSSAIGDMKPKDQRSYAKVLSVLKQNPRFSCFEASERPGIANTMTNLKIQGLIEYPDPQPGYPWNKVKITDKGEAYLLESQS